MGDTDVEPRIYRVPLSVRSPRWPRPTPADDAFPGPYGHFLAKLLDDQVWAHYEPRQQAEHTMRYRSVGNGELLESWHEPLRKPKYVRDEDLVQVRELLLVLSRALAIADRDVLERVEDAIAVLEGQPKTEFDKLTRYLEDVEDLIWQVRSHEQREAAFRERCDAIEATGKGDPETVAKLRASSKGWSHEFYRVRRDWLARKHHPAFANLNLELFRETLMSAADDPERRGGGGQRGPAYVAAELAVDVNAFNAAEGRGNPNSMNAHHDDRVRAFRGRLQREQTKRKRSLPR